MSVPSGVIIAWPSTADSIPSGWSRVTSLDDRYVKGAAAEQEPDDTGGASTHTHTSPTHTHTISAHTHSSSTSSAGSRNGGTSSGATSSSAFSHTHTTGTSSSNSGTSGTTAGVWNTASSDPPFVRVIFISSDGSPDGIPDTAWAWWFGDSLPDDWIQPEAAKERFLKGAAPSGDGGGTGGSATHTHSGASHTHSANHTHTGTSSTPSATNNTTGIVQNPQASSGSHTHGVTWSGGTIAAASSAETAAGNSLPPYRGLAIIENDLGSDSLPGGLICLWLGSLASIPSGWILCDGSADTPDMRDRFVRGVDELIDLDETGGSLGHTHDAPAGHTHAMTHTHGAFLAATGTAQSTRLDSEHEGQFPIGLNAQSHTHSVTSAASASTDTGSGIQTVDENTNTQPPFRTVLFIQFQAILVVDVTAPEETVNKPAFDVAWDLAFDPAGDTPTQNSFRVRIYNEAQDTVMYDSDWVVTATQEHTIGSWAPINNTNYNLVVDVIDTTDIEGSSGFIPFLTSWTPPSPVQGFTASPVTEES